MAEIVSNKIKIFAATVLIIVTAGAFATYTIWEWVFIIPSPPRSELQQFSVSNVTTSIPGFTMNLDVKVKITNPSSILKIKFEGTRLWVYYDGELVASSGIIEPFTLKTEKSKEIYIKLSAKETELGKLGKWIVEKIANERASKGTVTFSLSMVSSTKRRLGLLKQHEGLSLYCDNIRVVLGDSSQGSATNVRCRSRF